MRVGKRVGLIAAAAAGLMIVGGIGARGADMPAAYTKAPFVPAPAYNWSGFYAGVTAGGGLAALPVTNMDGFIGATLDGLALKSVGGVAGVHLGAIGSSRRHSLSGSRATSTRRASRQATRCSFKAVPRSPAA